MMRGICFLGLALVTSAMLFPCIAFASPCNCQGNALIEVVGLNVVEVNTLVDGSLLTSQYWGESDPGLMVSIHWCTCITTPEHMDCADYTESYEYTGIPLLPLPGNYYYGDEQHGCGWRNISGTWTCVNFGCW